MYRRFSAATAVSLLMATTALAQNSTATGVGISAAKSTSVSGAVAISGQGGGGGQGGSSSSNLTINNPANTTSTVDQRISGTTTQNVNQNTNLSGTTTSNINQRTSGETTSNVNQNVSGSTTSRLVSSGTTTVRTAPSMVAPGLAAAGLETCLGSASGTVSAIGFGIGGGSTYADEGCQARLDSRTLYAYGLKAAAVARLCQRVDIWRSMPDMCAQYWPAGQPYPAGVYVAPAGVAVMMSATSSDAASAGVVRVIDGRDGVEKDCLNYNATKQRCNHWSGEQPRGTKQRVATNITTPHRVATNYTAPPRIVVKPKPKSADPAIEPPTP